jgi:hypothetical protein
MVGMDCSSTKRGDGTLSLSQGLQNKLQEYFTIDEAAFIECVGMNIDLDVVFVSDVQSIRNHGRSRAPILQK